MSSSREPGPTPGAHSGRDDSDGLRPQRDATAKPPLTAGLALSVVARPRLREVVAHFERARAADPAANPTAVLLTGLTHDELVAVAERLNEPSTGTFTQLLRRLQARC
jgi:hypothetical protein